MTKFIFVDVEASGKSPFSGVMTELGAVDFDSGEGFYSALWEFTPDPKIPAIPVPVKEIDEYDSMLKFYDWLKGFKDKVVFVSDNPAYDWQWVNFYFDKSYLDNPFGFSARRIGDFYAGLSGDWKQTNGWKKYRKTKHDHNPLNDARGNVEAVRTIMTMHNVRY